MPLVDLIFRRKKGKPKQTASTLCGSGNGENEIAEDVSKGGLTRGAVDRVGSANTTGLVASGSSESNASGSGFFSNASNAVLNQPVMTDISDNSTTIVKNLISTTINNIDQGKPVLEALSREMTQGADVDSSARYPPPKCYPGTRKSLTAKIQQWLIDDHRTWDILWLHGPAGVGKSAVAQTIAEYAKGRHRLGAAFFFSKTNRRKDPQPVFITLAYQLAVRFPGYLPLVAKVLGADPDVLQKAPHVQFRQLIVEPLSSLSAHPKHVIILDGLDECDGEISQLHIVELINDIILSQTSLPIIWMICSRPEPHLMRTLSRADFSIQCWREELAIDTEESRDDTAKFIRTRFSEIHDRYGNYVEEDMNGGWPPEECVVEIINEALGLFVFASTILMYIEDAVSGNPDARLAEVLAVIRHSQITGSRSPMETLDQLYTRILSEVSEDIWPVTHRLLKVLAYPPVYSEIEIRAPQFLSNFLGIARNKFYAATRKLHAVLDVPTPDEADTRPLQFLHASFRDYLVQPARSGRLCVSSPPSFIGNDEVAKLCLRIIASPLPFLVGSTSDSTDCMRILSRLDHSLVYLALNQCLTWPASGADSARGLAERLLRVAQENVFSSYNTLQSHNDQHDGLQDMLRAFDYNSLTFCLWHQGSVRNGLPQFVRWVKKSSLHDLVRTHSISETDDRLLSHLKSVEDKIEFLDMDGDTNLSFASKDNWLCFLLGYDTNAILVLAGPPSKTPKYYSAKSALETWPSLSESLDETSLRNVKETRSEPITIAYYVQ